uniref:Uncharacterized protein n=1 Tax=Cucumis sativus TaxID=3659 RepID=A0A0A0KY30_CUCSA
MNIEEISLKPFYENFQNPWAKKLPSHSLKSSSENSPITSSSSHFNGINVKKPLKPPKPPSLPLKRMFRNVPKYPRSLPLHLRNPSLRILGRRSSSSPECKPPHPNATPVYLIRSKPKDPNRLSWNPL